MTTNEKLREIIKTARRQDFRGDWVCTEQATITAIEELYRDYITKEEAFNLCKNAVRVVYGNWAINASTDDILYPFKNEILIEMDKLKAFGINSKEVKK
jgi:20S proteasome alpha/beta subunit